MKQYLDLCEQILTYGKPKTDRTGTGTLSIFGTQTRYDLNKGFPLMTTKKVKLESVLHELLWFLRGSTNINDGLSEHTKIWNPWADKNGDLGPIYGYQWCKWERFEKNPDQNTYQKKHINQIQNAIDLIKNDPASRRIIVSAWNVADLDRMALMPCHAFFQFYVNDGVLDCQLYQRSADVAIGVPYNIASYSALLMMIAQECHLTPGTFVHTIGDAHLYNNHIDGIKEQLKRSPHKLPQLKIAQKPFWDIAIEDFSLINYTHEPFIKFEISV